MARRRDEIIAEMKSHPDRHRHTFDGLRMCCLIDGAIDLDLMQKHEGLGPGPRCDVVSGECSCGASHVSIVDEIAELDR